jgi:hypothetical protein
VCPCVLAVGTFLLNTRNAREWCLRWPSWCEGQTQELGTKDARYTYAKGREARLVSSVLFIFGIGLRTSRRMSQRPVVFEFEFEFDSADRVTLQYCGTAMYGGTGVSV